MPSAHWPSTPSLVQGAGQRFPVNKGLNGDFSEGNVIEGEMTPCGDANRGVSPLVGLYNPGRMVVLHAKL